MSQPNILVIISDDQGYGDLSCMGAPDLKTPHLDSLAESGVLFDNFYSNSPVCSPSRASMLTGKYPGKAGVRSIIDGHRWAPGLPQGITTLPAALKNGGYRTDLVGKWHLGVAPGSRPNDHGFDNFFGFLGGTVDYFSHINYGMNNRTLVVEDQEITGTPVHDLWQNDGEIWHDGRYMTEVIGEKTCERIDHHAAGNDPFYLHVAFNAPHFPLHAPNKYRERFAHLPAERGIIAAMISALDDAIGTILARLDHHGLRDDTIVFFMSDNGPSREIRNWLDGTQTAFYGSTAGALKGHKFSLFEGGVRVPGIISWPSRIPSAQHTATPMVGMDVMPTFLEAAGIDSDEYDLDGTSMLDVLTHPQIAETSERDLFWEQGDQTSIRRGEWKLVLNGRLVEEEGPVDEVFLSNLRTDVGESKNLVDQLPELAAELTAQALQWRNEIEHYWDTHWVPKLGTSTSFSRPAFHR
ncbi:Arylsulfatase [Rhodococcus erythropolis]|uniref:sulfatase family protein n=1 Tax=Rhodococcus erythropolis TaxID=1833 RepID=UPI000BB39628|nr:sulfatase-like hydrolase/transferase [Rhodococcus erythropolis]PBI88808.1 Arylsulfatase [Rhodococcus erythropolis]